MALKFKRLALATLLVSTAAFPAMAQSVQPALTLSLDGDAERHMMRYDCGEFGELGVDYLNAAPNFLALLPVEGKTLIFTAVLSASGVRYASGQYEWWTKGTEATLRDLTQEGEDTPPLASCSERIDTP